MAMLKKPEGISQQRKVRPFWDVAESQRIHLPVGDKIWQMFGRVVGNNISPTIVVFPIVSKIPMGISMEKLDGQFPSFQWRRSAAL